jgi:ribosome biogenesis GTPase / thiamine phosphate phosphatase
MAKRRLTKQQRDRIKLNQAEKALSMQKLGDEQKGKLVAHYGIYVDIEDKHEKIHRCNLRQNIPALVVGDRVVWKEASDGQGIVVALLPRETELTRHDSRGQEKLVAANVDQIIVTCAVLPEFSLFLLDSYLAAAELTDIPAIIVLNKIDLSDEEQSNYYNEQLNIYHELGYTVLMLSAETGDNINTLKEALSQHSSVFVGQSGVGKSSLIQYFVTNEALVVGELSEKQKLGRHTTTTSKLYPLKNGGNIIDSPGVREFGLGNVGGRALLKAFKELAPFLGECKFRNCSHQHEPGCALLQALEDGKINPSRMESFQKLFKLIE